MRLLVQERCRGLIARPIACGFPSESEPGAAEGDTAYGLHLFE